jgi:hypothetical protein
MSVFALVGVVLIARPEAIFGKISPGDSALWGKNINPTNQSPSFSLTMRFWKPVLLSLASLVRPELVSAAKLYMYFSSTIVYFFCAV